MAVLQVGCGADHSMHQGEVLHAQLWEEQAGSAPPGEVLELPPKRNWPLLPHGLWNNKVARTPQIPELHLQDLAHIQQFSQTERLLVSLGYSLSPSSPFFFPYFNF